MQYVKVRFFIILYIVGLVLSIGTGSVAAREYNGTRVSIPRTEAGLRRQLGRDFRIYVRKNYIIATDLDERVAKYAVYGVFDNCRKYLQNQLFDKAPDDIVTIYIFKDKDSYFYNLRKHMKMDPISPFGHYGDNERYIAINYEAGIGTLVHEMVHSLMSIDFPDAPLWISEGMATLYEQCHAENGKLVGAPNWRLPGLHNGIRANKISPLKMIFSSSNKDFRMTKISLHYAQCRYFCLYLQERGLLERYYKAFRDNSEDVYNGIRILESAFGKDIDSIERDWIKWVKLQEWNGKGYE